MKYIKNSLVIAGIIFLAAGISHAAKFHSLESVKVDKAPKLDGNGGDAVWKKAKEIVVEAVDGPELAIKSIHTDKAVFFQIQWEDEGASNNQNMWIHEGKAWGLKQEIRFEGEDPWEANSDRIAFQWVINDSIPGFDEKGCRKICHAPEKEDKMYTDEASQRTDIWHWISSVTNPLGYADDQYLDNSELSKKKEKDDVKRINIAHKSDDGGEANQENQVNSDSDKPKFSGKKGSPFIIKGEEKPLSGGKKGDLVPGYVLSRPAGSRGDINAKGSYSEDDFLWTLELGRGLTTKDGKNDVQFNDLGKSYFFGLAVWDNDDLSGHFRVKKPIKLIFK